MYCPIKILVMGLLSNDYTFSQELLFMHVKTLTNIQQKNNISVQINCPQAAALFWPQQGGHHLHELVFHKRNGCP